MCAVCLVYVACMMWLTFTLIVIWCALRAITGTRAVRRSENLGWGKYYVVVFTYSFPGTQTHYTRNNFMQKQNVKKKSNVKCSRFKIINWKRRYSLINMRQLRCDHKIVLFWSAGKFYDHIMQKLVKPGKFS